MLSDILGEKILKAVTGIDDCQRELFSSTEYDFKGEFFLISDTLLSKKTTLVWSFNWS